MIAITSEVNADQRFPCVDLTPTFATPDPGIFQPNQPNTTFFANISPKPSMTPLTNGNKKLIARLDANAPSLVRAGRFESNIARVAERGRGADRCVSSGDSS